MGDSSPKRVTIVDLRKERKDTKPFHFKLTDNLDDLLIKLIEETGGQNFVLTFPNRVDVNKDNYKEVTNNSTLWLLNDFDQKLNRAQSTPIRFTPYFHTITNSGMYEYYDSQGINSFVVSLAELIDNSLAATKDNTNDIRFIEIRYYDNGNDSMVVLLDNGHGMDFKELNDWARFKYPKSERQNKSNVKSEPLEPNSGDVNFSSADLPLRPSSSQPQNHIPDPRDRLPRYLDSEINFFGAGGKQAIFNIGDETTMISKTKNNSDVIELTLSYSKFKSKAEKDLESVYEDEIITRSKGKVRQIDENAPVSEHILNEVISDMETKYQSFTICAIKGVYERHFLEFKKNNENSNYWTKGLARIYHYYLHGPKGNVPGDVRPPLPPSLANLKDIKICIQVLNVMKPSIGHKPETTVKHIIDLKEINDDFESLLVRRAVDTFEFEVEHKRGSFKGVVIEGVIHYYPYLYDHETLPMLNGKEQSGETSSEKSSDTTNKDIEDISNSNQTKTKENGVFECFWHGRLIPQEGIDFEWTKPDPKNVCKGYEECYNRLSGALFTNNAFQVTQNKLSFIDLKKSMLEKNDLTFFRLKSEGSRRQKYRKKFELDFFEWLKSCHIKYDKQVLYKDWEMDISRNELPTKLRTKVSPNIDMYSVFHTINWRDRDWKKGDLIQTQKTKPMGLIGRINRFYVPKSSRNASGNYMGSPGYIQIHLMPEEVYGTKDDALREYDFNKINVNVTNEKIDSELNKTMEKLPKEVELTFPNGYEINDGGEIVAGTPIGDINVILKNMNGEKLTSDRIPYKTSTKKINIQTDILRVLDDGETEPVVEYEIANWDKKWDFWNNSIDDGIKIVGKYRLMTVCITYSSNDSNQKEVKTTFENGISLPSIIPIEFTVIAGPPKDFSIETDQFDGRLLKTLNGQPFELTLKFTDEFGNPTKPDSIGLPVLSMNEKFKVEDSYIIETLEDRAVINNIIIYGPITENQNPILKVSMPSIEKKHEIPVILQKGNPSQIKLYKTNLEFINGEVPEVGLLLSDRGSNEVTFNKQYSVFCRIYEKDSNIAVTPNIQLVENMHKDKRALTINKEIVVKGTDRPFNLRKFYIKFEIINSEVGYQSDIILKKNNKPSYIRLFYSDITDADSEPIEIPNGCAQKFAANSNLSGVHFKAYDFDDSAIDLNDFKEQTIRVSWHHKPCLINGEGQLPNIHVHTNSSEDKRMQFEWKQKGIDVQYFFTLRPYADSARRMSINTNSHDLVFPVGVLNTNSIQVSIFDAYNNTIRWPNILERLVIRPMTPKLKIDDKSLKKTIPRSDGNVLPNSVSFVISNIKLLPNLSLNENDSVIGDTRLEFTIQGLDEIRETVDIKVTNGPPYRLKWLVPHKCLNLMNKKRLEIGVQVCDEFNNPVMDNKQSVTLILGPVFTKNHLISETDELGVAVFSETLNINQTNRKASHCVIPPELETDFHQRCSAQCYGFQEIQATIKYQKKIIESDNYWLHITCDNKNPIRMEYLTHDFVKPITKSTKMPYFTVRLFAEDNSLVTNFDKTKVEMHLINNKDGNCQVFPPVPPFTETTFRFRIDEPPLPNDYKIKFVCNGITRIERDFDGILKVLPDIPYGLANRSNPLKKYTVVTNFGPKRAILESPLILDIVDRHNISINENIPNHELETKPLYSGFLFAKIINDGDKHEGTPIPKLEGCNEFLYRIFPIKNGRVVIRKDQLRLRENTPGKSDEHYIVELRAQFENLELNKIYELEPFLIKIIFTEDTERLQQLNEIQSNISFESNQRNDIQKELDDKKKELELQRSKYIRVRNKEKDIIYKLTALRETSDLSDGTKIANKLKEIDQKLNQLKAKQSGRTLRGKHIENAPQIEGVIGKIADLAFIVDEGYAKSISWFLGKHMNTIVVKNKQTAERLSDEYDIQSTLSLDMIKDKLPRFNETLLHHRAHGFTPYCTIGWVRSLLQLNETLSEKKDLENVFTAILEDTLSTTDLQKAKQYRIQLHERFGAYKTIVTKDGILYENGIIEMIPKDDNFVWFQSPPDRDYIRVQKIFDLLNELFVVYNERIEEYTKTEKLDEELKFLKTEKERELKRLEQTIHENTILFSELSHTPLDENFNRRYSPETNNRRRSYDGRRSRSKSGETKRPRY